MIKKRNNKLVVVLGMHRSGTSAITRGLQVMGVELGDRMLQPVESINPKGFWEDMDLNALNIEMLNAIGSDWCHVAAIDTIDVEILRKEGYFIRAAELLRQKVSGAPVFGFKDPRVAKLLPFWDEVFSQCQFDLSYVLTVRNPLSVAESLSARDGIEAEQSYLMWLGHVITSLRSGVDDKCVLVDYDRLIQSPGRELNRIAKRIDLKIDSTELQKYKNDFLDPELRHAVYDLNDLLLDETCPPIVYEIYTVLLDMASDKTKLNDVELQNKIVRWSNEVERLKSSLKLVDKLIIAKEVARAEHDGQIASLEQTLADQITHIDKVEADWSARGQHITVLDQTISDQITRINKVEADWSARGQHIAELEKHNTELEQTLTDQVNHIDNVEADRNVRGQHIVDLEQILADQKNHIRIVESALMKFKNSVYGKCITALSRIFSFIKSKRNLP